MGRMWVQMAPAHSVPRDPLPALVELRRQPWKQHPVLEHSELELTLGAFGGTVTQGLLPCQAPCQERAG